MSTQGVRAPGRSQTLELVVVNVSQVWRQSRRTHVGSFSSVSARGTRDGLPRAKLRRPRCVDPIFNVNNHQLRFEAFRRGFFSRLDLSY
jgi:hypothetical protein